MSTEAELLWAMKHLGFCYEYLSDLFVRGDGDAREVVTPEQARRSLFDAEHGIDHSVGESPVDDAASAMAKAAVLMDAAPVPEFGRWLYDPQTGKMIQGPLAANDDEPDGGDAA